MLSSTERWLAPIYEKLHKRLLQNEVLHADETTVQVLRELGRNAESRSYMWVYRTSGCAEHPIVLYKYEEGRSGKYPEAFTYLKNQKQYLYNYLLDGRLESTNNRAERSVNPFVIAKKNFLFANTPKGAAGSSIMFSIIETAKENKLDPYRYLTYVFSTAPNLDQNQSNWIEALLPENAPEDCKLTYKHK